MTLDQNWGRQLAPNPSVHDPPPKITGAPIPGQDQLESWGLGFIDGIVEKVVLAIVGVVVPGPIIEQLQYWSGVLLPAQILDPISQLVELLVTLLGPIPIVGTVIHTLADYFGLLHGNTNVAQGSADTANVGLAILNARVNEIIIGGVSLYDTFARDVDPFETDPDYDVAYAGGSGHMRVRSVESGILDWYAVGFSDTSFVARHLTPFGTNKVRVSTVIGDFTYGFAGNQSHVRLMGRMNAARDSYVVGIIDMNSAEIGYVVSGSYTRIGGAVSISTATGDLWDLEVGTSGDEWRFRLLQNNSSVVDRTDLGHASMKDTTPGTTYKFIGIGGDCAIGAGPFGTTYQIGMPKFQVLAAADY